MNVVLLMLVIYFGFHFLSGQRGLFAYMRYQKEIAQQKQYLSDLVTQKLQLEQRVILLNPKSLDKDFLEELAMKNLGLVRGDDFLLKTSKNEDGAL